ncbi:MAG: hypothetical protein HQL53_03220 [Magnetococcales bacterium]|nr:hypothetical protein [Magnetococcales bacterium]
MRGAPLIPIGQHDECGGCSASVLDQFAKSFDKSAKRWELIVYPSLFAFIILAMYGFFLIYSLTQDIRTMASSIDPKMGMNMGGMSSNIRILADNVASISTHLEYISDNMETMSVDMQNMAQNMEHMSINVTSMDKSVGHMSGVMDSMSVKLDTLGPMSSNMQSMTQAMHVMTGSVSRMGYDMNGATRPMSFMNQFMPW